MPAHLAFYADLTCPYAYLAAFRLRMLREEYRERIVIAHKCLALEYVNRVPTPKRLLDAELPLLMLEEPDIPYRPWDAPESEWPVTVWPAFEAVKCAERQSAALADELAWAIRVAFFAERRCISMRHVVFELAEQVGLDLARFADDFDGGAAKRRVVEEARDGWERLRVAGSPTFVLPSGKQVSGLGLPELHIDEAHGCKLTGVTPAPCRGAACLDLYRAMLDEA
jgi:predicted DsbA family dithiol-disulfide isomerase